MSLQAGQTVYVDGEFRNDAGALANPTAISVVVTRPDGSSYTKAYPGDPEIALLSTGNFRLSVPTTTAQFGTWSTAWTSTGAVATVKTSGFNLPR